MAGPGARASIDWDLVRIEPPSPGDLAALRALVHAMHEHERLANGPREDAALDALLADPSKGSILVARHPAAGLLGYVVLGFGYSLEFQGRDAFVDELFVTERARGHGIGTLLLQAAEVAARAAGVAALHLEVDHENPRARSLYESTGYRAHPRSLMTKWLR